MTFDSNNTGVEAPKPRSSSLDWKASGSGRGSSSTNWRDSGRGANTHQVNAGRVGGRGWVSKSGGRGGGGGRGANTHSKHRELYSTPESARKSSGVQITIVTSDFITKMHIPCGAAEYKVHAPLCDCNTMQAVRKEIKDILRQAEALLDGLVVLPKIKSVSHVYVCQDQTDVKSFALDPLAAERRLRDQLFPTSSKSQSATREKFKLSGASCMLQHEPNGFVCVYSKTSSSSVHLARDKARRARQAKSSLHADHAHFVCTLPHAALWKLKMAVPDATQALWHYLSHQVVLQPHSTSPREGGVEQTTRVLPEISIELGHHLTSLLCLKTAPNDDQESEYWWLTLVYDDTKPFSKRRKFTVDLPGGKRHLGESSLDGAMRETEEETSLVLDESWVVGPPVTSRKKDAQLNTYFMLSPPFQDVMDDMTSDFGSMLDSQK
jgi:hypothetical protein